MSVSENETEAQEPIPATLPPLKHVIEESDYKQLSYGALSMLMIYLHTSVDLRKAMAQNTFYKYANELREVGYNIRDKDLLISHLRLTTVPTRPGSANAWLNSGIPKAMRQHDPHDPNDPRNKPGQLT